MATSGWWLLWQRWSFKFKPPGWRYQKMDTTNTPGNFTWFTWKMELLEKETPFFENHEFLVPRSTNLRGFFCKLPYSNLPWELRSQFVRPKCLSQIEQKHTPEVKADWLLDGNQPKKKNDQNQPEKKRGELRNPQRKLIHINQPSFLVAHYPYRHYISDLQPIIQITSLCIPNSS